MKSIILGAGLTGLTAGITTGFPIYEASSVPGGLCRSYRMGGYHFERGGGHWFFGDGKELDFLRQFDKFIEYKRRAGIYFNNILPYPIQNYLQGVEPANENTLKEWLGKKFSNEMCRLFFYPFNEKYTCGLYDSVIQDDEKKSPTRGAGYNETFFYPNKGTQFIVDEMAKKCDIKYNKKAVALDIYKKIIVFSGGDFVKFNTLISTIPIKDLLGLAKINAPDLCKTSVAVTNIGTERGRDCPREHWLYCPDEKFSFFRVGFYSNVKKEFTDVKDGISIGLETAFIGKKPSEYNKHKNINVLSSLGFIGEVDVFDEKIIDTAYTWVMPGGNPKCYLKMLKEHDIISTGRYGKWKFQGMLDSIKDGMNVPAER